MKHQNPNFEMRFAASSEEIRAAQRLRYRVFVEELGARPASADDEARLEIDRFDDQVRHLCLFDQARMENDPENMVIGVYRLITDEMASEIGGFYTEGEYDIGPIKRQQGRKLELGRSCIDAEHRGGAAMAMLWSGLGSYVEENAIDYLFGVASYQGTELPGKRQSLANLRAHYLAPEPIRAVVLPEFRLDMDLFPPHEIDRLYAMRDTPSLIKAYLRLGGVIGDGAFIDREFNTIDVFVLMKTREMVAKYRAMYSQ